MKKKSIPPDFDTFYRSVDICTRKSSNHLAFCRDNPSFSCHPSENKLHCTCRMKLQLVRKTFSKEKPLNMCVTRRFYKYLRAQEAS